MWIGEKPRLAYRKRECLNDFFFVLIIPFRICGYFQSFQQASAAMQYIKCYFSGMHGVDTNNCPLKTKWEQIFDLTIAVVIFCTCSKVAISFLGNPESIEQIINKLLSVRASLNSFFFYIRMKRTFEGVSNHRTRKTTALSGEIDVTVGCAFYSFSNDALNDEMFLDKCTWWWVALRWF